MNILQPKNYLSENKLSIVFFQLSSSPDVREKVTAAAYFHYINNMTFSFKTFIKSDNVSVSRSFKNVVLLHNLLEGGFVVHEGLVD